MNPLDLQVELLKTRERFEVEKQQAQQRSVTKKAWIIAVDHVCRSLIGSKRRIHPHNLLILPN
jgi:hypothetical protein